MRILSVINNLKEERGGPPEVLRNQIRVINKKEKIIDVLKLDRISLFYLLKIFFNFSSKKKIYNFLKKYDIIHFHEIWSLKIILICSFAKRLSCKFLFVGHGHLDQWSLNQSTFKKKIFINFFLRDKFKAASAQFFSNLEEFNDAKNNFKFNNVFIIPNGIDIKKFLKRDNQILKKKKIIFFGRIHKKKGIEILIEAVKLLPEDFFNNFEFEICGPGEEIYLKFIKDKIKNSNLGNNLRFKNFVKRDEKINYLSKASVFVLPSFEEGDSIALKEALAMSIPVIISKQCRLSLVEEYNAGIVIELSAKNLTESLIQLSKKDLAKMSKNARKLIEDKFDNESCSERVLKIYQDIHCGSKSSPDWII